jgi:uncharacterized membrane protein YvbJ
MGFCTKCGTELDSSSGECLRCLKQTDTDTDTPAESTSKHRNKFFYSIGGLVLIGAAIHFTMDHYTSPDRMIENFQTAVAEEDVNTVKRHLSVKGNDTNLSTEYVENLIAYLNADSYVRNDFSDFIQDHLHFFESATALGAPGYYEPPNDIQFLSLENSGKQFLLYDSFDFYVEEYPMLISSNYEDIVFQVNGEEVEATQQRDGTYWLGDFPAGNYEVTGTLDFEYGEASLDNEVPLLTSEHLSTMDFYMEYLYLSSDVDNLDLYYNGENTQEEISRNDLEFGPILLDGGDEFHVEGEAPFGSLYSEPMEVGAETYHTFHVVTEEEVVENALKNLKTEAKAYEEENYNTSYDFLGSVEIYPESQWVFKENDNWFLSLDGNEIRHDYHNGDFELYEETFPMNYTFLFNEGEKDWELHTIEDYHFTNYVDGDIRTIEINSPDDLKEAVEIEQQQIEEAFLEEGLYYFFDEFLEENVYAVNTADTYYLESLIHPDAVAYKEESFDYIESLYERNITQSIDEFDVLSFEKDDEETVIVNTMETYTINYDYESTKIKSFESKYEVKDTSTGLKLVKLIETTEISSEDLY